MIYEPPDYRKLYEEEKTKNGQLQMRLSMMAIGMRDHFATAALPGLMLRYKEHGYSDTSATAEAYSIADDMMEARKQEP